MVRTLRLRAAAALALILTLAAACGKPARSAPAATTTATVTASPSVVTASLGGRPAGALHLDAVDFLNAQIGWLAGRAGSAASVLRTLNGGASWEQLPAGRNPFLRLDFVGPDNGWALVRAGSEVQIEHTTDGGATWRVQWLGAAADMQYVMSAEDAEIDMLSLRHGFAVFGGRLLATANGGGLWRPVAVPAGFTPTSMSWRDAQHGWLAGMACAAAGSPCHVAVLATADGGGTWRPVFTSREPAMAVTSGAGLPGVSFPTAAAGWLFFKTADLQGRLYASVDGGATWTLEQPNLGSGRGVVGLPVFADARTGWLPLDSGAAPAPGGIEVTHDGGRTWTLLGSHRNWSIRGLAMVSPTTGWAIGGPTGGYASVSFLVGTTDGGATWAESQLTLRPTRALDFVSTSTGYGAGSAANPGAVLRSTDGGATWSVRALLPGSVTAISFTSASRGWALDQPWPPSQGLLDVMATTDGGATWTDVAQLPQGSLPPPDYLRFFSSRHGILMTGFPPDWRVLVTRDGGRTWTPSGGRVMPPQASFLTAMPAAGDLLLLKQGPVLDQSADGGVSWHTVPGLPQGLGQGIGLGASGPKHLWLFLQASAAGTAGPSLARSANGGRSWSRLALPAAMRLEGPLSVSAISPADAWVLSATGLFATHDGGRTWTWLR